MAKSKLFYFPAFEHNPKSLLRFNLLAPVNSSWIHRLAIFTFPVQRSFGKLLTDPKYIHFKNELLSPKNERAFPPLYESYANLRMQVCCSFPTSSMLVGSKENPQTFRAAISLGVYSDLADPILVNFSNS